MKTIELKQERLLYIDILKLIALILMPIIHFESVLSGMAESELLIYQIDVQLWEKISGIMYLFAPGIFMFCMGVGIVMSSHNSAEDYIKRGFKILKIGFILNLIRGTLVYSLAAILFEDYSLFYEALNWLVGSDILYFAGLFLILFGIFKKAKLSDNTILMIALIMQIVGTLLPVCDTGNTVINGIIGNFIRADDKSFFPIVWWTIYPVYGYIFQKKFSISENKTKYMINFGLLGAFLLVGTIFGLCISGNWNIDYLLWGKHELLMTTASALITIGIESIYISAIYFISMLIKSESLSNIISQISSRVNIIYCIHWVLEMNGVSLIALLFDIKINNIIYNFIGGFIILVLSIIFAFAWEKIRLKIGINIS